MNRKLLKITAFCLAALLLCLVPAEAAGIGETAALASVTSLFSNDMIQRLVNYLILPIHELIVMFRRPWEPKENEVDLSRFELTFEDEFEGETLSDTWWSYSDGVRKGGYWDREQAFLENGNLVIRTQYQENGRFGPGYYSWRATTKNTFEQAYGYFEVRCILPAAQGLWSAFWLTGENVKTGVPATEASEIDIFESPLWLRHREKGIVTQNIHYGGYETGHRYTNVAVAKANNPYEEYNTYGLEWTPEEYIFYVNGKETGRSAFGGVCRNPLYLLLSVEVDGVGGKPSTGWSGLITENTEDALPADFVIDYVRVYQHAL